MVQTDDEVLNYQHCRLTVEEGGDHNLVDFEQHLPTIADFSTQPFLMQRF